MATSSSGQPDTPVYNVEPNYVKRWRVAQEDWTLLSIAVEGGMVTERWLKHPRHTKNNDKGDKGDQVQQEQRHTKKGDKGDSTDKVDNADKGDKMSYTGDNNDKDDNADKGGKTFHMVLPSVIKPIVVGD